MRILWCVAVLAIPGSLMAQDLVATTNARTPEEERKAFRLPPGFEVQLVASEPDIQKPMQLAFDDRGRIFVATSHHYPFAVEAGKGTDKVFVLSDFGIDGKAKKVTVFDDKLNIPIGILPLPDGSVIVSEAGRIMKLKDTDDDDKADTREVLFSGFGTRDTHGMTNSFTLLPDGWVYACHGYLNDSKVKGKDGHEIIMNSGHTFRFRPDGSRIEIFTRGQVNPFGMCVDPWQNLYTADCHSRPITQLIRGACYESFGKPHDGLGYAPHVINHMHGSTGLCGIAYCAADYYPKEWNNVMFVGNVVTNRINCDRIVWKGSTPVGQEMPDFLVSDDPWFRPVDLKFGSDGALYVSDFYNKIIGHYEVDLRHPGRDKERGRIWRIVCKSRPPARQPVLAVHDRDVLRAQELAQRETLSEEGRHLLLKLFHESNSSHCRRACIDGMAAHPHVSFIDPLLGFIPETDVEDTHMKMAARIALRNCIVAAGGVRKANGPPAVLYDVIVAIRSKESSQYLAKNIGAPGVPAAARVTAAEIIGQFQPECLTTVLLHGGTTHEIAQALMNGMLAAGTKRLPDELQRVVNELVARSLSGNPPDWNLASATLRLAVSFPETTADIVITQTLQQLQKASVPVNARASLAEAVATHPKAKTMLRKLLADTNEPLFLRSRIAGVILAKPTAADRMMAKDMLKTAPYAFAVAIATGLASDRESAELLFACIQSGEAPARLLQERSVINNLRVAKVRDFETRVKSLTKDLPSTEKRLDQLIKDRAEGYHNATKNVAKGKDVYAKHCAICHQMNGEGARIGPQLDGVGSRGLERLLEDTIDPNRNVDVALRATKLDLKDGRSLTGLLLREEGVAFVIADALGKEQRIPKADVDEKTTLAQSAMPANLDTTIPEADYYSLIAYLLDQKTKKP